MLLLPVSHFFFNLPQASRLLGMTNLEAAITPAAATGMDRAAVYPRVFPQLPPRLSAEGVTQSKTRHPGSAEGGQRRFANDDCPIKEVVPAGEERDVVAELVGCIYVQPEVSGDVILIRRVIKLVSADPPLKADKPQTPL